MTREEPPAADAVFGVVGTGIRAADGLDPGPDPAGVLPAAAGAAEPLAEDSTRSDDAALVFVQRARERARLSGGTHAGGDECAQQVGGHGEAAALRDVVDVADDLDATTWSGDVFKQCGEALTGALHADGDDPGGDHGGL